MLETFKKLFPDPAEKEINFEKYKEARGLYIENPWLRVKSIFQLDAYWKMHPELTRALQTAQLAAICGGAMGALRASVRDSREFIRTNDTNVYMNEKEMYKKMANRSLLAMGKGAMRWAPKFALFAGGFSLMSSCCEAYRNKSGVIEYVVGGYVVGGVSRSAFGIKGFVAGGIIGAVLGLIFGTFTLGLQKLAKKDALELKYAHYAYIQHRKQLFNNLNTRAPSATDKIMASIHDEHKPNPLSNLKTESEDAEKNK